MVTGNSIINYYIGLQIITTTLIMINGQNTVNNDNY